MTIDILSLVSIVFLTGLANLSFAQEILPSESPNVRPRAFATEPANACEQGKPRTENNRSAVGSKSSGNYRTSFGFTTIRNCTEEARARPLIPEFVFETRSDSYYRRPGEADVRSDRRTSQHCGDC
jgi:hypothetical protein